MKIVKHNPDGDNTYDNTILFIGNKDYNQALYAHDAINAFYSSFNR